MTDRIHALTVVLDRDYREDDVQVIIDAIKMIKGVSSVEHDQHVTSYEDYFNRELVRAELQRALYKTISDFFKPKKS